MSAESAAPLPVLVSPAAGTGDRRGVEALVRAELPGVDVRFLAPDSLAGLADAVTSLARQGIPRLAVAGGDGTLHHVVNALGDAPLVLAPIPTGTGNDFCRGIGLTGDPAVALRALAGGRTRRVDLIEVNGHRVCTVAGLGLVADTGVGVGRLLAPDSRLRRPARVLGQWTYLAAAAARLLFQPRIARTARIQWQDDEGRHHEASGRMYGVFLANLPTLGAGLRLPVRGRPDDGRLELAWLPRSSRLTLVRSLRCLRGDRPVPAGALEVRTTEAATVAWTGASALLADGEDLGPAERFIARALPGALLVPAPA